MIENYIKKKLNLKKCMIADISQKIVCINNNHIYKFIYHSKL